MYLGRDQEVRSILDNCYSQAIAILKDHMEELNGLGRLLIEKETVTRAEFLAFINGVTSSDASVVGEGFIQ